MAFNEKRNQSLMQLIRRAHGFVESPDIEKHRQSQNQIGALLGNNKEITYTEIIMNGVKGEWVSVNRARLKKNLILYCHGGGYSTGSCIYARTLTSKLADTTSMDVLAFDYRLAPEHIFPSALEDGLAVWNYLMHLGYGARDIVLAGDSAGGNLALAMTLKLKEEGRLLPRGMILLSPWTDLTSSGKSHQARANVDPVLNKEYLDRMIKNYTSGICENEEDLKNPYISPLFGDFSGFPPVYIQVGDNEILLSDSIELRKKMLEYNVSVKLDCFQGMWHVFQMSPFKKAYEAMNKNAEFIYDICK